MRACVRVGGGTGTTHSHCLLQSKKTWYRLWREAPSAEEAAAAAATDAIFDEAAAAELGPAPTGINSRASLDAAAAEEERRKAEEAKSERRSSVKDRISQFEAEQVCGAGGGGGAGATHPHTASVPTP